MAEQLQGSLMLATALAPHIGYELAAQVARQAQASGSTLREAALALGATSAEDFARGVDARAMALPEREPVAEPSRPGRDPDPDR